MSSRRLEPDQRQAYFDRVSRSLAATQVGIEIAGPGVGDQTQGERLTLRGMSYDPRADQFELLTEELDHLVSHPRELYVDDAADGLHRVELVDGEGNRQIYTLSQPLRLPGH
ncbi:DUF5335 family protein [Alkalilimnicola sp. S0819]|uniref:DUF5335 family protein n=1 Tax=Alkalilimnicola sp. S0819 TaxID=2613922 RepID=UPI0012623D8B|nr:DUF5335 family protein [Alkalilimnicola sp. S0819]KAB7628182.1 hypothetical protein F3N43_00265 [Alkalilimnicola sp. S0819]MPQ15070.1 hypothetical protein [Alkalilimnicola sp. S0819]